MGFNKDIASREQINKRFIEAVEALLNNGIVSSKKALADVFGIGPSTLTDTLYGRMKASTDMLAILCGTYAISTKWLLLNEGGMFVDLADYVEPSEKKLVNKAIRRMGKIDAGIPDTQYIIDHYKQLIKDKDDVIIRQAEEIGRLKERVEQGQIKNVSNACTQSIADAG